MFSSIGGGSAGNAFTQGAAAELRRAVLTLTLAHRDDRKESIKDIEAVIRHELGELPGARFQIGAMDNGVKMQIVLRSEDAEALDAAAQAAVRDLRTLKGVGAVSSSAALVRPEIIVRPDTARAADLGVTTSKIGETVRVATAGDYDQGLPKLNLSERQIPVRVKLPDATRSDLAAIERLTVPGKNGQPVMLGTVASVTMESGPAQINRLDRSRNVTLDVELGTRSLGEAYEEALQLPALKNLPPGVKLAELGDAQEMNALFESFSIAMAIGVFCIYGVLVLLFKDFMQPATILAALPLSIGGAFVGLLITHNAMSIALDDRPDHADGRGDEELHPAGGVRHRRAPAGHEPLALGMGADPAFRSPMAIAVIGGLITSTLLSLLVVPAVFTYVDDLQVWMGRLAARLGLKGRRAQAAVHAAGNPEVTAA